LSLKKGSRNYIEIESINYRKVLLNLKILRDANMSNDFARFIAELEGENAKKLLNYAGKNVDNKPVTTVKKAMDLS
jgi:hypothetical protein